MKPYSNTANALSFILSLLILLLYSGNAFASQTGGEVVFVEGEVEILKAGKDTWRPLKEGARLEQGDLLRTGADGRAGIRLDDESLVRLHRYSRFQLTRIHHSRGLLKTTRDSAGSLYRLGQGELWLRNNNPSAHIDIETPTVVAGIRGTEIGVRIEPSQKVTISILEGRVEAGNDQGRTIAGNGEAIVTEPGKAPTRVLLLNPRDAVQWTIRMPEHWQKLLASPHNPASQAMRDGQWLTALQQLQDQVRAEPQDADSWELLALSALLLDRTESSAQAAGKVLALRPDSASAWVLQGYVQQSAFALDAALQAYDQALQLEPDNLAALLNKARVLFGDDRLTAARRVADRAIAIAPDDPQARSMSGFLALAERRTATALQDFADVRAGHPGYAEAYLGEAIALMRQGRPEPAFDALATAVLLEPGRSLYLSYWGKMLYQVERPQRALRVLESAARADPRDPTPLFYQAVILRDLNRPGEAVKLLNRAIALNDRRGVYRSRFLLDRDLASRNVDLSLAYGSLGLGAWAENKALKSVKSDYFNAAGHIFYAGSLSGREGRSRVFANEALLGRLLQPANVNTFNTYNDYTTLFEQPDAGGTLSLSGGNHATAAGRLIAYGSMPEANLAYSAGLGAAQTDGWRDDNGSRARNAGVTLKWEPTPRDNLTFSLRTTDAHREDSFRSQFEASLPPAPLNREESDALVGEFGYHHRLAPGSDLLMVASFYDFIGDASFHTHNELLLGDGSPAVFHTLDQADTLVNYSALQLQWLYRLQDHQLILGGIRYDGIKGADSLSRTLLQLDSGLFLVPEFDRMSNVEARVLFQNAYLQDIWNITPELTLEAALYLEHMQTANVFSGGRWSLSELNPRLGLIWRPSERDTLRLAAFRYLLPFVFSRLDPADVAGVPLYRSSDEGSVMEEIDLIWEREWSSGFVSANLFSMRKRAPERVPPADGSSRDIDYEGSLEGLQVEYNQLLGEQIGLAAVYRYLDAEDDLAPLNDRRENAVSVGLRWVRPDGFSAGIAQTLRAIDFDSAREDEFIAITDIGLAYELPDKRGSIGLRVNNLFNRRFDWVTDRFVLQGRSPARELLATLSLNF